MQVKSPGSLERCIAKLAIELPKVKEQENDSARFSQIDTSSATKVRKGEKRRKGEKEFVLIGVPNMV